MTTKERARLTAPLLLQILADYQASHEREHKNLLEHAELSLLIAFDAVADEEREACREIVHKWALKNRTSDLTSQSCFDYAEREIRARSEKGKQKINIGWIKVEDKLPSEGEVVETKIKTARPLIYRNGVWWLLDNSTIVICTPTHWRRLEKGE
jgi:hypothetical protein